MNATYESLVLSQYDKWTDSAEFWKESAVENGTFDGYKEKISAVTGKEMYHEIADDVLGAACEAQYCGFKAGLRYGMLLVTDIMSAIGRKAGAGE